MSQRHHLVPRFYLDRWKVSGIGLTAIRRSTGEVQMRNPKSVAAEADAYAIEVPNRGKDYLVEKMLSRVESEAALALRNMLESWPPSDEDRSRWGTLMALQITRGRDFRDSQNAISEYLMKTMVALDSRDPEAMRRRLEAAGLEATEENLAILREMMDKPDSYRIQANPAHLIQTAVETGLEMLRYLAGRQWSLGLLDEPNLVTGDHPLSLHSSPESPGPFGTVGLMTADEVWMPLDPSTLLIMTHPDTKPRVGAVPMNRVRDINFTIAAGCYEWVVARPDNPHIDAIAEFVKGQPAPRLEIAGPTLEQWAEADRRMSASATSD